LKAVSWIPLAKVLVGKGLFSYGTAVAQWLRCYKSEGRCIDGVIGIFHWHNPSDLTMALGSNQPLTEMSTRTISWR